MKEAYGPELPETLDEEQYQEFRKSLLTSLMDERDDIGVRSLFRMVMSLPDDVRTKAFTDEMKLRMNNRVDRALVKGEGNDLSKDMADMAGDLRGKEYQ